MVNAAAVDWQRHRRIGRAITQSPDRPVQQYMAITVACVVIVAILILFSWRRGLRDNYEHPAKQSPLMHPFSPLIGVLVLLFVPAKQEKLLRWVALAGTSFRLVSQCMPGSCSTRHRLPHSNWKSWPPCSLPSTQFHLGIDGVSLSMIVLTVLLVPLAILTAFSVKERVKAFMVLFLLLQVGLLGVFMSLDLILFSSSGRSAWCRCTS